MEEYRLETLLHHLNHRKEVTFNRIMKDRGGIGIFMSSSPYSAAEAELYLTMSW